MGLLTLGGLVAVAFTALTAVTLVLIRLVVFLTLPYTLLGLAILAALWLVNAQRRHVAKGFYSCRQVPASASPVVATPESETASMFDSSAQLTQPKRGTSRRLRQPRSNDEAALEVKSMNDQTLGKKTKDAIACAESLSATESEEDEHCDAAESNDEDAAPVRQRPLPRALPAAMPSSSSGRRSKKHLTTSRSRTDDQEIQKALDSDGYWIGDYRIQSPTVLRSASRAV